MNMLDKHRILQEGDEYFTNAKDWQSVPSADWGIQIMFTKYSQVRRPSEPERKTFPLNAVPVLAEPELRNAEPAEARESKREGNRHPKTDSRGGVQSISPDSGTGACTQNPAKAESEQVARPVVAHGTGERSPKVSKEVEEWVEEKLAKHKSVFTPPAAPPPAAINSVDLMFAKGHKPCQWLGRNGQFDCVGLNLFQGNTGTIWITPHGKRGMGRCMIEFPAAEIPRIVDWLMSAKVRSNTP